MKDKVKIDWLSVTATWRALTDLGFALGFVDAGAHGAARQKGRYGYNASYQFASGFTILFNEGVTAGAKCHAQISGKLLDVARAGGLDDDDIIDLVTREGYHLTRVDVALDVVGCPHSLLSLGSNEIYTDSSNNVGRPLRKTHIKDVSGGGETIYIGSRQSDRMMRCYDKGAEQKQEPGEWLRFEIEFKGARADWAARAWQQGRAIGATEIQIWRLMADGMVDHPYFGQIDHVEGSISEFTRETGQVNNTWRWLVGQVRVAIGNYMDKHGTEAALAYIELLCGDVAARGVRVITPYGEVLGGDTDGSIPDAPVPVKP
ncbi:MAG: replication initiation factor domain-containing protein [Casimicrobium sp.]